MNARIIKRRDFLGMGLALAGAGLAGCAGPQYVGDGWQTVIDGRSIPPGWTQIGAGNWKVVDGAIEGTNGKGGYLVSPQSYTDFEMRVEFWADYSANSGVFLRCQDRNKVGAANAYEVNIWDFRPDPNYGTGAIVDVAKVAQPAPSAANRWNIFEICAVGDRLQVSLNGRQTVDVRDGKHKSGPFALQSAAGTIRFRRVDIRVL